MEFVLKTYNHYLGQVRRLSSHRSYRRLLIGSIVSALGDRVGYIAFLAAVTSHSQDALAVAGITISEMLPGIIALPLVSLIVDRFDKRYLLICADLVRAALFIAAAFVGELWLFFVLGFASMSFTMLFEPSRQALEPHYVPEGELTQANGLRQGFLSLVMMVGPAIGGILAGSIGYEAAFLVNACSFLFSAYMVSDLDPVITKGEKKESAWREIAGGYRTVKQSPALKYLFALMGLFALVIGIQFPLIYVWVHENLGGGPSEAGWLFSAIGVGGLIGGTLLSMTPKAKQPFDATTLRGLRNIAILSAFDGLLVVLFAPMTSIIGGMMIFACFGAVGTCFHVAITTAFQELSPVDYRGRVFSLHSAVQGPLIVLSIALGTPLAREHGAEAVFFVSGGLEVLLGLAGIFWAKRIMR